ncbi:unnamed protein product [Rotaria magnacalcarata]|uniref:G-protein coupled receptors family 1 profile domain-containing protein n=1 Tax=Rotaria magnacalcarata TaxID=392030 RepID=A0A819J4H6_9BILA|nr:unnamed protein product [Rotaria magnacalcarata]CAF2161737.1 unnamed protein product [Rotaria magnacalcarata]CAF3928106.1 unnamed protein product [Rotaria magnacalcarata]CAF3955728.1 unnamed protein product [Rotaria magnacalcarata]
MALNFTVPIPIVNVKNETLVRPEILRRSFVIHYLSIYALLLTIFGTIGNVLTIVVLFRRHLRRFVTVRYLIAVSICDIISLYGWNLNNFYKFNISRVGGNIEDLSLVHCRLISFMTFVALQLSSWCLSAVSLDRCLSLYWLQWKQSYGRIRYTKYYLIFLTLTCLTVNSHILFLNGYSTSSNGAVCYRTRTNYHYIYPQWERVHLVLYNLCPFAIMCICNTYIIYVTVKSSRSHNLGGPNRNNRKSLERYRQFTALLIIVTFAFVILTLPACIYFVFFRNDFALTTQRNYRYMIQIFLNSIQFTCHGINFFLYCFSASSFRHELYGMFRELVYHCRCKCGWLHLNDRQNIHMRRYKHGNHTNASPLERQRTCHA